MNRPGLIDEIKNDIHDIGVVGDPHIALGVYLIGVSRLLDKPLAGIVRGATSSGKSYGIERTGRLFPPETKIEAHAISPKALYYMPDDALVHKFVLAGERQRHQSDEASDATKPLREMISDGILRCVVTEQVDGKMQAIMYSKPGPIAYVESTSAPAIFAEDANRCLVFNVDESEQQTRRIISAAAAAAAGNRPDVSAQIIETHHAIQRMLKPYKVLIPYASELAERFPASRVEARRAWPHLLGTISAVALLRQFQKQVNDDKILADADDYAVSLDIIAPSIARLAGGIDSQARRIFEAVKSKGEPGAEFTRVQVAYWAGCQQSDTNGRIRILCENGLLIETQEHKGSRPAKYKIAEDAPDIDHPANGINLPDPSEIARAAR